nr:potassium channel subfamily T member 2-like [Biomphalaria glabrata]KAI8740825.1 potassium channel subfamily T member 2-like [Biomphalaria glabrata]
MGKLGKVCPHCAYKNATSPIVVLLEDQPDALFLDTLAHFPLVCYMTGSIWSVDDLLVARITQDSYL